MGRCTESMEQSVVAAVRDGSWREFSVDGLAVLATIAAVGDVTTTAYILYSPEYWEGNLLLATLVDVGASVTLAVFASYALLLLVGAWLSFGWFSDVLAGLLVGSMGIGGLNNLVLFLTDVAIYTRIGISHAVAIHVINPFLGFVLGLAVATRRGALPWREVSLVVCVGVGHTGALFVL